MKKKTGDVLKKNRGLRKIGNVKKRECLRKIGNVLKEKNRENR